MTATTTHQFKLTLEQREKLGKVYFMIFDWHLERQRRQIIQSPTETILPIEARPVKQSNSIRGRV